MNRSPRYAVIAADPPWMAKNKGTKASPDYNLTSQKGGKVEHSYSTMTTDEVAALRVSRLCLHSTLLAIWVPWIMFWPPDVPEGILGNLQSPLARVLRGWQFSPITGVPWIKGRWKDEDTDKVVIVPGMGNYVRVGSEILVLARRGRVQIPPHERLNGFIDPAFADEAIGLLERRGGHSVKPAITRHFLDKLVPRGPRLELFAREVQPGWDSWGNEVPQNEALISVLGVPPKRVVMRAADAEAADAEAQ